MNRETKIWASVCAWIKREQEKITLWIGREVAGNGSIGGWDSAVTGTDGSGADVDDTWTTSTSLCGVCEGLEEAATVCPDCNNWAGVTREGTGGSVRTEFEEPTIEGVICWGTVWYDKLEPEIALGLLANGTAAFISEPPLVKGASDGKLAPSVAAGSDTVGALFETDAWKVSGASVAEGAGGKIVVERFNGGAEVDVMLGELVPTGRKADGNSGKFEGPVGNEELKLGNCNGCCIDESIGCCIDEGIGCCIDDGIGCCIDDGSGCCKDDGIGCCIDEGMDKPGGGRNKDCWCNWGSPFGAP